MRVFVTGSKSDMTSRVHTGRGGIVITAALFAGGILLALSTLARAGDEATPNGGTLRVSFAQIGISQIDSLDPARAYTQGSWAVVDATCARLVAYPDKPPPAGARIVPEVATGLPQITNGGKKYTFTLKTGYRFSNGAPVRASAFARAIYRALAPALDSPAQEYLREIVGAADVRAGRTTTVRGVVATANRLEIRFTEPVRDFIARLTTTFFCAVPPTLPADPEGIAAFPAAGPYYIAEYRPGVRAVLRRNRFYGGTRPHRVDSIVVDLDASSEQDVFSEIERGEADWGDVSSLTLLDPSRRLAARYGVNKGRFFVSPGLGLRAFAMNMSRPLFKNNLSLRRAINFAVDRPAYVRATSGTTSGALMTDQYLPPTMLGFRDANIYPLRGPNLAKARKLARGHTRNGKLVLYCFDVPPAIAGAQVLKRDLARIGLAVEITPIAPTSFGARMSTANEPYDMAPVFWAPDYLDPFQFLNVLFDGRYLPGANSARFDSPKYNTLLRRAALLRGSARYEAYGKLDVRIARDAAPLVAISVPKEAMFVSARVGCVVYRPSLGLDLPAACLKR
jgi:peptide/nickel transport system substrate-binding protein